MIRKLLALLAFLAFPGVARADWYEAGSAHFVVYSSGSPQRLEKFASDLEHFDQALRILRQLPNSPVGKANRVNVYLLGSSDAVGRLIGNDKVLGFYIPRAGGSVAFAPRDASGEEDLSSQEILFHEYSHHLMLEAYAASALPAWLVEGWAEYHATAKINRDGSVLFGTAPRYRSWGLLAGNPLPLDRILAADTGKLNDEQTDALYGRGWALIHYLTTEHARAGQLGKYVADINAGKTPAQAAAAFGDWHLLHRELEVFISKSRISGFSIPAARLNIGEIAVRKLTPGEAAMMSVRIRSKHGVDEKTAPPVYADAKKAAAPFPTDPGAQIALAEAAYDAGDYKASEAAADRALAADPNAIDGYVYKAMSEMAVASAANDFGRETWGAIRKIIASGNHLDPEDPEPLILYFRSYVDAHQVPTRNARDGIYHAIELCPQDRSLRMNVAQVYLHDGNPHMARALLVPLAYDPHSGALSAVAAKMIADIDARKPEAAAADAPKPASEPPKP